MKHDHPFFGLSIPRFLSHGVPGWTYGLIMLCGSVAVAADQEPSYDGRLLSQWLGDLLVGEFGSTATEGAVRAMGTNAIPTLLKWIAYEPSPSQRSSQTGETVLSYRPHYPLSRGELAQRSQYAFECLGAVARPAIPELTRLARTSSDSWRAERCAAALAFIGPEAIPSFLSLATNGPPWTRSEALSCLARFAHDPEGEQAVPVVITCLGDTNTHYNIDGAAQGVLSSLPPAVAVPAITNALQSPSARVRQNAIACLLIYTYGAPAMVPVAAIRAAMRDTDYQVRDTATNILRRTGGWELVDEQWVRRWGGTNTLYGITPDFFTNAQSR
jgi:HEAT repeat protein